MYLSYHGILLSHQSIPWQRCKKFLYLDVYIFDCLNRVKLLNIRMLIIDAGQLHVIFWKR